MKSIPPSLLVAIMAAVTLGVPLSLYALLTRGRRRIIHEIKSEASRRGWAFHSRRWLGDPTAFRIDGWTRSGLPWVLKTGGANAEDKGWTVRLGLHFPSLAGEMDLAMFPHKLGSRESSLLAPRISSDTLARMAEFSATAASAGGFFRDAQETPSGLPSFDAAYQILSLTQRIPQVPIDAGLAERILKWPSDAVAPQEILAWRDSFGLHLHAHLPATPNWGTITHFVGIAQDFCARLPVPVMTDASKSFWDRLLGRILES